MNKQRDPSCWCVSTSVGTPSSAGSTQAAWTLAGPETCWPRLPTHRCWPGPVALGWVSTLILQPPGSCVLGVTLQFGSLYFHSDQASCYLMRRGRMPLSGKAPSPGFCDIFLDPLWLLSCVMDNLYRQINTLRINEILTILSC